MTQRRSPGLHARATSTTTIAATQFNGHRRRDGLRGTLEAAGGSLKSLTVLSPQNDPFRVDADAGHRDGAWLASDQWRQAAQQAVDAQGGQHLEALRADAADRLAEMRGQIEAILRDVHVDADMFNLPEVPEIPVPQLNGGPPEPLIDSRWSFAEQCLRLIASKGYHDD